MIETLSHGITCIDTGYHRAGLAACYLVLDDGEAALIETGTALNLPAILRALTDAASRRSSCATSCRRTCTSIMPAAPARCSRAARRRRWWRTRAAPAT
jgi:hypothetical protein